MSDPGAHVSPQWAVWRGAVDLDEYQARFSAAGVGYPLGLEEYDALCAVNGLALVDRWATWDREPYQPLGYAVSVHRLDRTVDGRSP